MRAIRMITFAVFFLLATAVMAQSPLDAAQLDAALAETADPDGFALVLLASTGDGDAWVGTSGFADLEAGIPAQPEDKFRIGSITKTFIAVVMLQLADEEILSLDDLMIDWLPDDLVAHIPYADEITIRQLLNMTSGIFSYTDSIAFNDAILADPTHPWTAEETIQYVYGEEAYFPPGEGYYYSNSNYNLLHIIIETAEEAPLAEVLHSRIFEPVGMVDTYLESPQAVGEGIVQGYIIDGGGAPQNVTFVNEGNGLGDGGIISTVADMERFARALFNGDLLSEDAMEEMTDYVDDGEGGLYGLGLGADEADWGLTLGHDGATAGFQSTLRYLPDYDLVVVGLTNNFDSEALTAAADAITAAVTGD